MASPCRAGAGVIRRVQGIPFPHGVRRCADPGASHPSAAAAASGDPGASVVSPLLPHMAGVGGADPGTFRASHSPASCGAGGGDPGAFMASLPPRRGRWGLEGRGRARLWWYSILSTLYIGT